MEAEVEAEVATGVGNGSSEPAAEEPAVEAAAAALRDEGASGPVVYDGPAGPAPVSSE